MAVQFVSLAQLAGTAGHRVTKVVAEHGLPRAVVTQRSLSRLDQNCLFRWCQAGLLQSSSTAATSTRWTPRVSTLVGQ